VSLTDALYHSSLTIHPDESSTNMNQFEQNNTEQRITTILDASLEFRGVQKRNILNL